jgi:hypothetical protein
MFYLHLSFTDGRELLIVCCFLHVGVDCNWDIQMIIFSVLCTDSSGEPAALMIDTAHSSEMSLYSGYIKNAWTNCRVPNQGKFHISICLQTVF